MKEIIITNASQPLKLEELYRADPVDFSLSFEEAYEEIKALPAAEFWRTRLKFDTITEERAEERGIQEQGKKRFNIIFAVGASLLAGTLIKIAEIFSYPGAEYIQNNIAFFVLPLLTVYYMIKNDTSRRNVIIFALVVISSALFMNLAPWEVKSNTRLLSSGHFGFVMWAFLGAAFVGFDFSSRGKQMDFLKRNGDMLMLTGVIIVCGVMLTGLTAGLFGVLKIRIDYFLERYFVLYGLAAAPIAANYMIETSPKMISKAVPLISKIFTPLILLSMTAFLIAMIFFANDPFNNRDELIVFNVLLVVNIAVIVFSFSGNTSGAGSLQNKLLIALSVEAVIINSIALSAIIYRLAAFGISPNRLAVLAANILMFINLAVITVQLIRYIKRKTDTEPVHKSMTIMLPWYALWALITAFTFPFIFWFK